MKRFFFRGLAALLPLVLTVLVFYLVFDFLYGTIGLPIGNAILFQGHPKKAIAYLDQSLKLDPKNFEALNTRGLCYLQLRRYEEATADFDGALALFPKYRLAEDNKVSIENLSGLSADDHKKFWATWRKGMAAK